MQSFEDQVAEMRRYFEQPRFRETTRLYTPREVVEQRGTIQNDYAVARDASSAFYARLRELYTGKKCITTFGPYSPGQAVARSRRRMSSSRSSAIAMVKRSGVISLPPLFAVPRRESPLTPRDDRNRRPPGPRPR